MAPPPAAKPARSGKALCPACMASVAAAELTERDGRMVCPACAGGTQRAKEEAYAPPKSTSLCPIQSEADVMTLDVKVSCATIVASMDPDNAAFDGKARLEINHKGMTVTMTGMLAANQNASVSWINLAELKNHLRLKGFFEAEFGGRSLKVKVKKQDAPRLARLFARLPAAVSAERCPKCDGVCVNGVCRGCGARPADHYRKSGLGMLVGGCVALGLGGALSAATFSAAEPGGTFYVFTGIMMTGFLLASAGLYQVIMGRKSN